MSSETQFLEKPGGRIAYDDSGGSGAIVIAAPGMGDTKGVYRYLAPLLIDAGIRMVTFDLRGLGESSVVWDDYSDAAIASDYISLVDHLGESPAVLFGNSKTASSVVIAATTHPDKVSGLVLLPERFQSNGGKSSSSAPCSQGLGGGEFGFLIIKRTSTLGRSPKISMNMSSHCPKIYPNLADSKPSKNRLGTHTARPVSDWSE
jgi:pimeloyl-ACP methyl ester carboxylesterase